MDSVSQWDMSPQIDQLATALAKAQAVIRGAVKDSVNPHFKNDYADLSSVREACIPALTAHGLSVVQSPSTTADGRVCITTLLLHASGQWVRDALILAPRDGGPQAMGSCITYGRRYALAAFAGVAPTDDDVEAAERPTTRQAAPAPMAVPDGFALWWESAIDLSAAGELDGLAQHWQQAPEGVRPYVSSAKRAEWDALKAAARKAREGQP